MRPTQNPFSDTQSRLRSWFIAGKYLPWLVLAVFLTATFFLWTSVRLTTEEKMSAEFDNRARESVLRIGQRMRAYEQVLRATQGLFAASGFVGRREFHTYYNSLQLENNYPGIQGVGFSLLVKPEEKDRHIRSVRREMGSAYTIKPEGRRDIYSSIIYLEPFSSRNLRAVGYDMYAEPVRHAAMERAADSGKPIVSGKVVLIQETGNEQQSGFLMFVPVYKTSGVIPAPSQRRADLAGWVYAPFRMNDLMVGLFGDRVSETDIEIYDGTAVSDASLMYDSRRDHSMRSKTPFRRLNTINVGGRFWTVVITSTPQFENGYDTEKSLIAGVAGIGGSVLLALLTMALVNSRSRALEAQRVESRYKLLMGQANDGILVVDMDRRITDANEQACIQFGYTLEELRTMRIEDLHPPESAAAVIAQFESMKTTDSARFEVMNRRKDGTLVPNEISERIVRVDNEPYVLKFVRDISERKHAEHEREQLVQELQSALADVKTLSGLIPICSSCKKIRDDRGYWNVLESYLVKHSDAQFTHGICPDCVKKYYPNYVQKTESRA